MDRDTRDLYLRRHMIIQDHAHGCRPDHPPRRRARAGVCVDVARCSSHAALLPCCQRLDQPARQLLPRAHSLYGQQRRLRCRCCDIWAASQRAARALGIFALVSLLGGLSASCASAWHLCVGIATQDRTGGTCDQPMWASRFRWPNHVNLTCTIVGEPVLAGMCLC